MFYMSALFLALGYCFWKWINSTCSLDPNHDCNVGTEKTSGNIFQLFAYLRKLGNRRGSEGLHNFKPSKRTNLLTSISWLETMKLTQSPGSCFGYAKNTVDLPTNVTCNDFEKRFHATCANPSEKDLSDLKTENEPWYCSDCKADCGPCSRALLNSHKKGYSM